MVVAVMADGTTIYDGNGADSQAASFIVSGGSLTLPNPKRVVHVGLPIKGCEIETLDLDGDGVRERQKRIHRALAYVYGSSDQVLVGPDRDHLRKFRRKGWQTAQTWRTGPLEVNLTSKFTQQGRVVVRHTDPLPFTLTGLLGQAQIGR